MNTKIVKARKTHRCDNCLRTIERGDRYETETQLAFGRGFVARKRCLGCATTKKAI